MTAAQRNTITKVIQDYSRRLLGFIRKRVRNEADAEDILQDVFFQFIGNTEPIEQVTSWLFTVARNKIIDRRRKKQPLLLEDLLPADEEAENFEWSDILFDDSANPETAYLRNLFWEALEEALDELPAEQKEVFVQHEMNGISFKQLSETTGIPVNTLLSRKRYAVLHLRMRLTDLHDALTNY